MRYIPKTIHLIWFGGAPFPPVVQKCVDSWKALCPEYKIVIWNEETFDLNSNLFVEEAAKAKKWAFVSDYVRLYALYNYGGVYIDSDVEVLKNFDELLEDEHVVTGYSNASWIPAGFMASEPQNVWVGELLNYYNDRHFMLKDGSYDMTVNNEIITNISEKYFGFKIGDSFIEKGNVRLYPRSYFHPYKKKVFDFTEDNLKNLGRFFKIDSQKTYCIHYSMGSWVTNNQSFSYRVKHFVRSISPEFVIDILERIYYRSGLHNWRGK